MMRHLAILCVLLAALPAHAGVVDTTSLSYARAYPLANRGYALIRQGRHQEAVALFDAIHSVDRPSICEALSKEIRSQERHPLLFAQIKYFTKVRFALPWWAYSFPMAAITISSMMMLEKLGGVFFASLAPLLLTLLLLLIVVLVFNTIRAMLRGEVCIPE